MTAGGVKQGRMARHRLHTSLTWGPSTGMVVEHGCRRPRRSLAARRQRCETASRFFRMPEKWTLPRVFLHHGPWLGGAGGGNEAQGLTGFFRVRADLAMADVRLVAVLDPW